MNGSILLIGIGVLGAIICLAEQSIVGAASCLVLVIFGYMFLEHFKRLKENIQNQERIIKNQEQIELNQRSLILLLNEKLKDSKDGR